MELIVQVCVSGLLLGGIYALISIGLNLIFGVVRIINFAHGEMVMVAMYLTFWLNYFFGMDPYVSTIIVLPVMFLFGVLIQRVIVQPIQNSSANMKIFATVALSLILQNVALIVCKGNFRTVQVPYGMSTIELAGIFISVPRLVAFFAALASITLLYYFLKNTYTGKALRAIVEDDTIARLMGVKVQNLYLLAFGIGCAFSALGGVLLMPFSSVYPSVGIPFTLIAFIVVVLGGLGSMGGTFLAGLFIGVVEAVGGTYVSPALKEAIYFGIFIIAILIRPQGIFGKGKGSEEVGLK
ncbi:MAG: branched-chain amino acid ABC transporter permease [Desulfarculaceae bacterium]|nr:branched-chain amino acid ABC transporter permease [Desulfarculaceae bacterium]MCF8045960.1 branched-chain amino acid ABC transporter permease [Desulfarculaceae bacterium]MCF8063689.1 branched-chain amino acid ABC transporter permease [Desulfarculaceae bacterium]MCF8097594.1 branched-chain amino acid ABC transporter permease [Desulfarculaceae bacterium]MCF8121163.1 branched-chain amino acid ABC transporter permease [Desulfarculaceae bacterium]